MKKIECILRSSRLDNVVDAVREAGVLGMTVSEVVGFGRQRGQTARGRGGAYVIQFQPKVKIEIVAPDEQVGELVAAITKASRTGEVGDGKVFVMDVESATRIRTGETAEEAL